MLYKIQFRICCPFDSLGILPPQESEIRCSIIPGKASCFLTAVTLWPLRRDETTSL